MASFRCSCGEYLIIPATGSVVCWFCRNEYPFKSFDAIQFESQPKRGIIKSENAPVRRFYSRRTDRSSVDI